MNETVLFPSPNWFQVAGLAVSPDNWIIYGGPSKSLCVLEPLPAEYKSVFSGNRSYQAHVRNRVHHEKIISVDFSPSWPVKRSIITGSSDGIAKQWHIERVENELKIKCTHNHDMHHNVPEELIGIGYSTDSFAISVGEKNLMRWDLATNVVKKIYNHNLKNFKPLCMACSPHLPLHVAIGTKQGIIFVWDLSGSGKVVFKVRGNDEEILNISWCPQYETVIKKTQAAAVKKYTANSRMEKIRNEPEPGVSKDLETSGVVKNLPEDSFDEGKVAEDDMFDIYKDHEADEFGHKKYQPEDIMVKVKTEEKPDFLAECLKLKEVILRKKNEPEPSIQSLVDKLEETHVDEGTPVDWSEKPEGSGVQSDSGGQVSWHREVNSQEAATETISETHHHLLASISKSGGVRIWSKSGKLVGSCAVPFSTNAVQTKHTHGKVKVISYCTLNWYKADMLLIADGRNQLLECNPLASDGKNKLKWNLVHNLHKRGLHCIATNAPRVQTKDTSLDGCSVWTAAQDRYLINYCMDKRKTIAEYNTCGGYLYSVVPCPYDAGKVAISVGDGAVRVWHSSTHNEDDTLLNLGRVSTYWQNVQGKVLTTAWHPVKENYLAFATAESRVGLLLTSGKSEKPARVLSPALAGGVYSLSWGETNHLYACANGQLALYDTDKPDASPKFISVEFEGHTWEVSSVMYRAGMLVCGSNAGAVAVMELDQHGLYHVQAALFAYTKMVHITDWHPEATSNSTEESPYSNLIAVCSLDKNNTIIIMEYSVNEDGSKQLTTWKTLIGHKNSVLVVAWNPHTDGQLLSTSTDTSVRVWDAVSGTCIAIFGGHIQSSLGAAWISFPQLPTKVLSGGGDCCLRLWDIYDHPPENYDDSKYELPKRDRKRKDRREDTELMWSQPAQLDAVTAECTIKPPKKYIMPNTYDQILSVNIKAARYLLNKYLKKNAIETDLDIEEVSLDEFGVGFVKIFGSINEVNEVLDAEFDNLEEAMIPDACVILSILRGHIAAAVQYAVQRDMLSPFIISIAPCVSIKYWKDVSQMYVSQVDKLVAQGELQSLSDSRFYGGYIYRKAVIMLSIHDFKGAVNVLKKGRLFKEAYILCRTRHMDSIAEEVLRHWAEDNFTTGIYIMAAVCYLALEDLPQAAAMLGKYDDQESLRLAADIAKLAGLNTLADHYEKKAKDSPSTEELLDQLPTRMELLLKDEVPNGEAITSNGGEDNE